MFYQIEIVRDEEKNIIDRRAIMKTQQPTRLRGKEVEVLEDIDRDLDITKVSVDENGVLFLEDDADKIAARDQEIEIALRIKRIEFGKRLIAIMSIRNDAKNLTTPQIIQLVTDFSDINTAWANGSIATSRALVDAITPDGTILTTADKTAILAEIDANLTALGYEV